MPLPFMPLTGEYLFDVFMTTSRRVRNAVKSLHHFAQKNQIFLLQMLRIRRRNLFATNNNNIKQEKHNVSS